MHVTQVELVDLVGASPNSDTDDGPELFGPARTHYEEETIYRHFACPEYAVCLYFAARRKWGSFSCKRCFRTTSHFGDWEFAFPREVCFQDVVDMFKTDPSK